MKLNTRFIKLKRTLLAYFVVGCGAVCLAVAIVSSIYIYAGEAVALSEDRLNNFAQNNILFYEKCTSPIQILYFFILSDYK